LAQEKVATAVSRVLDSTARHARHDTLDAQQRTLRKCKFGAHSVTSAANSSAKLQTFSYKNDSFNVWLVHYVKNLTLSSVIADKRYRRGSEGR